MILRYFHLKAMNGSVTIPVRLWKFFQIELCRFFEVGHCFFDRNALAHRADLGTFGDVEILFLVNYGG